MTRYSNKECSIRKCLNRKPKNAPFSILRKKAVFLTTMVRISSNAFNKLASVFHASVLSLIMNFVITLSN